MELHHYDEVTSYNNRYYIAEHERAEYELTNEHIHVMLHQEDTSYAPCVDYTSEEEEGGHPKSINNWWRQMVCEWAFDVADHFGYSREIVSLTMNYLDRYTSAFFVDKDAELCKKRFQLSSAACLLISAKITGAFQSDKERIRRLRTSTLVELGCGLFSVEAIEQMEKEVFSVLRWRINPPTAIRFISHFMQLFPKYGRSGAVPKTVIISIFEKARYLSELSVGVAFLAIKCKQSAVAVASLLNAMECISIGSLPQDVRTSFAHKLTSVTRVPSNSSEITTIRKLLREACPNLSEVAPFVSGVVSDDDDGDAVRRGPLCLSGKMIGQKRRRAS
mmetsp:Transcript_13515/g.19778  ORF Transcript_13515/g.19778 Transcript_13515/m.19778 type:complete len:333 (-) Transcript_13515:152-1150(-)